MAESKMLFDKFIAEEVMKYKGISYPVKTGAVKRMLTRKASVFDLHPNPDDEWKEKILARAEEVRIMEERKAALFRR